MAIVLDRAQRDAVYGFRADGFGAASLAASWSSFSDSCRSRAWISGLE
jgi:hypothetical protein